MIFNQFQPAAAQDRAQPPAASSSETADTAAPVAQREIGNKPVKPLKYNPPPAPKPLAPSIKLSADPKFVTGNGSVTVHWSMRDLPKDASLTLKITFPTGYTPTGTAPGAYDASTQTLSLPVTATTTSGDFSLNVQNPIDEAVFPATLMDGEQVLADGSLSLPKHESSTSKRMAVQKTRHSAPARARSRSVLATRPCLKTQPSTSARPAAMPPPAIP